MNQKEDRLKSVFVSMSSVHGKGLFAKEGFKKGTYIGDYKGPIAKKNGTHVLWVTMEDGTEVGMSGKNKLRYLNHSNKPNSEFNGFELYTKKNIKKGDEITFHYGDDPATW